jgi:hypothetical protein
MRRAARASRSESRNWSGADGRAPVPIAEPDSWWVEADAGSELCVGCAEGGAGRRRAQRVGAEDGAEDGGEKAGGRRDGDAAGDGRAAAAERQPSSGGAWPARCDIKGVKRGHERPVKVAQLV